MILSVHRAIVRAALGDSLSAKALRVVAFSTMGSDLYQWQPERHFDSARDVAALGDRWRRGLRAYLTLAVERAAPTAGASGGPRDRLGALRALGMASHALADFYAHTNWVEIHGANAPEAPLLGATWPAQAFPPDLASGYFSVRYGLRGCPRRDGACVPPAGYHYCHETLNKDAATRGHGAERIIPGGPTYHEVAVRLAEAGTRALWRAFRAEVSAAHGEAGDALVAAVAGFHRMAR